MTEPPPMTEGGLARSRATLDLHDHAICTYETQEEMLAALATFLLEGRSRRELSVFVHAFASDDEAWTFIERAVPPGTPLRSSEVIVVSLYESAFEGGARRIDHEHVGRIVGGLESKAAQAGLNGTRIFVDASRAYFAGDRAREWFAFEAWLGRRLQAKVGLVCAYQRGDIMRPDVLPDVLRTHAYRFDADP